MTYFAKIYVDKLHDARLMRLDPAVQLRWYQLQLLAVDLDAGGAFIKHGRALTDAEIAFHLHIDETELRAALKSMQRAGLMFVNGHGWEMKDFEREQGPTRSDTREDWRRRQYKHRHGSLDGYQPVTRDTTVTSQPVTRDNAGVTPLEEDSDSESESDKRISSSSSSSAAASKKVKEFYKQEFGKLSDAMNERLERDIKTYSAAWVMDALVEAVTYGKKSLAYAEAILARWHTEGKVKTKTKGGNRATTNDKPGNPQRDHKPGPAPQNYSADDRAAAERIKARRKADAKV